MQKLNYEYMPNLTESGNTREDKLSIGSNSTSAASQLLRVSSRLQKHLQ